MVKIRRGNVILRVSEEDGEYYRRQGYDIVNDDGSIVSKGQPTTESDLRRAYNELTSRVAELTAEIERLSEENSSLKTKRTKKSSAAE